MNDQVFTDSYTQIYRKSMKIIVGRNIIKKMVIMDTKLEYPVVSLICGWILTFGMGIWYPPKS